MTKTRSAAAGRGRLFLAVGLAVVVLATVIAEAATRSAIDGRIAAAADKRLTGPVSVGIGATPALLDAVTGQIPTLTIQAPSTSMCALRDVSATASLTGVHRARSGAAVQRSSADVTLTTHTFTALLSRYASADVTTDPAAGDLRIGIGPGGILQVDETAVLHGDVITFSPASMSLTGRAVPANLHAVINGKLTFRRQLTHLPLGLGPRSVAVTGDGVQIHLTAGPSTISPGKQVPARSCASP
jgi:DUF2993 family protein